MTHKSDEDDERDSFSYDPRTTFLGLPGSSELFCVSVLVVVTFGSTGGVLDEYPLRANGCQWIGRRMVVDWRGEAGNSGKAGKDRMVLVMTLIEVISSFVVCSVCSVLRGESEAHLIFTNDLDFLPR
jgi:hypothetical protein